MITDYWVIRRGHYRLSDLYTTERGGWYWYTYGINLRAYAAYISGILINVVGFAGASELQRSFEWYDEADLMTQLELLCHSQRPAFTRCLSLLDSVLGLLFPIFSWLNVCTTGISALIYIFLNWIKPSAGKHSSFCEVDLSEGIKDDGSGRSSPADDKQDGKTDIYTVGA